MTSTIRRDPSELRLGIVINVDKGESKEGLEILNKNQPLQQFVDSLIDKYGIQNNNDIEVYVNDHKNESRKDLLHITEENRDKIKTGNFLHLIRNPDKTSAEITKTLNMEKSTVDWNQALKELHSKYLTYPQFTAKFIEKKGHERLLSLLGSGKCSAQAKTLCYQAGLFCNALLAVRVLFKSYGLPGADHENGMVSWALIDDNVLNMLISGLKYGEVNFSSLECCYDLLDHCIQRLPDKADFIIQQLDSQMLFYRLSNDVEEKRLPKKEFQVHLLKLLNTIFRHAKASGHEKEIEKVHAILTTESRDIILKSIPALRGQEEILTNNQLLAPLVEFQQHVLCLPTKKCKEPLDPDDMNRMTSLNMMRSLVTNDDVSSRLTNWKYTSVEIEHFRALGFENCEQPYKDFDVTHGGVLAFECVSGFFNKYSMEAEELLSPKSHKGGSQFPFVRASGILTNMLAKKFRMIGDLDNQCDPVNETDFFPLLFSLDNAFEQVFSKCIIAFARTWRDMRATDRDVETVRKVIGEQLMQTFSDREYRERLSSLDAGLQKFNYAEILRLQHKKEEEKRKNKEVSEEIRRCLRDRINKCISENRINHLQRGQRFILCESSFFNFKMKNAPVGTSPTLFLRLDRYMKHLYYEKSETNNKLDKSANTSKAENRLSSGSFGKLDEKEKISLANITQVTFGTKLSPAYAKKTVTPDQANCCMTLVVQTEDDKDENSKNVKDINLIAPDITCLNIWKDGLNSLKGFEGRSSLHDRDFERLVGLEEKVRCLHLPAMHDVTKIPPIPPDPPMLP